MAGSGLSQMTASGSQDQKRSQGSAAEMLLEVIIFTLLYELRGSLGPENLSDIPNWTAYT